MKATFPRPLRIAALFTFAFGVLTLFSGGAVIFGPDHMRDAAGAYMPMVVWFNFLAGAAYIFASITIWRSHPSAFLFSLCIALATLGITIAFAINALNGAEFEGRTVGALSLRIAIWAIMALAISTAQKKA